MVFGVAHGLLTCGTFIALTALGCGQVEYLRLKICQEFFVNQSSDFGKRAEMLPPTPSGEK